MDETIPTNFGYMAIEDSEHIARASFEERGSHQRANSRKQRPTETISTASMKKNGSRPRKSRNPSSATSRNSTGANSRDDCTGNYNDSRNLAKDIELQSYSDHIIGDGNNGGAGHKTGYYMSADVDQTDYPTDNDIDAIYPQPIEENHQTSSKVRYDQRPDYTTLVGKHEINNQQALKPQYYTETSKYTPSHWSEAQDFKQQMTSRTRFRGNSEELEKVSRRDGGWVPPLSPKWVSAKKISAVVLEHHINWHRGIEFAKDESSCVRLRCDRYKSHVYMGNCTMCLYTYKAKAGYLIFGLDYDLSLSELDILETQSQRYAETYRAQLCEIIQVEFSTAMKLEGNVKAYRLLGWPKPSNIECIGAAACWSCDRWTPYGGECYHCQAVLPSMEEEMSKEGSIASEALAAMKAGNNSEYGSQTGRYVASEVAEGVIIGGAAVGGAVVGGVIVGGIFMLRIGAALAGI